MSNENSASQKILDYSTSEIKAYLDVFRKCVIDKRYSISKNEKREENIDFIEDYKINTKKEQEILLGLQFDDFCYGVKNKNEKFPDEILYVFCKEQILDYWGEFEYVEIYIKINMVEGRNGDLYSIIVSFHKRNYDINYLFK